jgi:hypothetical protein
VKGNAVFTPEMDGDFRIVAFNEFFNEHGFTVTYDLPREFDCALYSVQNPTPLPFWIDNVCHVIPGDADKEEPEKLFGGKARENAVLRDIARLLDDARSGRISDQMREWASENITNAFADVFYEEPSRARYWVSRYRVALQQARRKTQPPHPIDNRLRQVAGEWLLRFGSKTDLSNLGGVLGNSAHQIFSRRQITDILFAFLVTKVAANDARTIDAFEREPALHKAFPAGLYHYYLEHGWPRVPFHYAQENDFNFHMMNALSQCHEDADYWPAAKLGLLLYGRAKLPQQIDSIARSYLRDLSRQFERMRRDSGMIFSDRARKDIWGFYAKSLLDQYDHLMDLDGIVNGELRARREPYDKRFGVPIEFLKDLKRIRKNEW